MMKKKKKLGIFINCLIKKLLNIKKLLKIKIKKSINYKKYYIYLHNLIGFKHLLKIQEFNKLIKKDL